MGAWAPSPIYWRRATLVYALARGGVKRRAPARRRASDGLVVREGFSDEGDDVIEMMRFAQDDTRAYTMLAELV